MIQRIFKAIRRRWLPIRDKLGIKMSRSQALSSFFYGLLNPAFSREHRSVLSGIRMFQEARSTPRETSSMLRRNTHRLEKGIISRPRREVFATSYIEETIDAFATSVAHASASSNPELSWARDVLSNYFEIVGSEPTIDRCRKKFEELDWQACCESPSRFDERVPYSRDLSDLPVEYNDLLRLAERRRSVRWFEQRSVPRELLLKAIAVGAQSPSACNRQPFEFRIFDDPDIIRKVASLPAGTAGFDHNFPCIVVVVGKQRYYFDERDRHLIYIDGSLATMSFILALETLGLSSCCINWPDIEEREIAAEETLQLESDERPVMFIAVGYPDHSGLVPYSEKRTPEQLSRFNFEARSTP